MRILTIGSYHMHGGMHSAHINVYTRGYVHLLVGALDISLEFRRRLSMFMSMIFLDPGVPF